MQQYYAPMAQQVQSRGRGQDTMLVHMTPGEVGGLQQLAMAAGGSLTINPDTGLPEAGWLGRLLPTILGIAGAAVGIPTWAIGLGGTAVGTAATGDLGKGLMAGLGAFGGASLAGATGLSGSISPDAFGALGGAGTPPVPPPVTSPVTPPATPPAAGIPPVADGATFSEAFAPYQSISSPTGTGIGQAGANLVVQGSSPLVSGAEIAQTTQQNLSQIAAQTPELSQPGFFQRFGQEAQIKGAPPIVNKVLPYASGYAAIAPALTPEYKAPEDEEEPTYQMRYQNPEFAPSLTDEGRYGSSEIKYFNPGVATPIGYGDEPYYLAEGDEVPAPRGVGATLAAQLPQYTQAFQTSPGAVTGVPFGYGEGQSPSELIRADIARQTAERQAAADAAAAEKQAEADAAAAGTATTVPGFDWKVGQTIDLGPYGGSFTVTQEMVDYYNSLGLTNTGGTAAPATTTPATTTPAAPAETITAEQIYTPNSAGGEYMFDVPKTDPSQRATGNMYGGYPFNFNFGIPFASGGAVEMESGGFVMPARETAEFGNGSTVAGQKTLAGLGGLPVRGKGDGVSDSIPAMIDGQQRAALANGETYFPPQAVKRLGGADKLRNMMQAATRSRQNAPRGGLNTIRGMA